MCDSRAISRAIPAPLVIFCGSGHLATLAFWCGGGNSKESVDEEALGWTKSRDGENRQKSDQLPGVEEEKLCFLAAAFGVVTSRLRCVHAIFGPSPNKLTQGLHLA